MIDSQMNGQPWRASKFAASLRRQLFRKHLGLVKAQDFTRPDENFQPISFAPNSYDWGSEGDQAVEDPLSRQFLQLWNTTASTNTQAFERVFHCVPTNQVRNWTQYNDFFERYFHVNEREGRKEPARYKWGHVVAELFSPGEQGIREVKEELSKIRGNLVEMPLLFLKDEDIAKEGLELNFFTEAVYT
jgi:phospholipase D1/2